MRRIRSRVESGARGAAVTVADVTPSAQAVGESRKRYSLAHDFSAAALGAEDRVAVWIETEDDLTGYDELWRVARRYTKPAPMRIAEHGPIEIRGRLYGDSGLAGVSIADVAGTTITGKTQIATIDDVGVGGIARARWAEPGGTIGVLVRRDGKDRGLRRVTIDGAVDSLLDFPPYYDERTVLSVGFAGGGDPCAGVFDPEFAGKRPTNQATDEFAPMLIATPVRSGEWAKLNRIATIEAPAAISAEDFTGCAGAIGNYVADKVDVSRLIPDQEDCWRVSGQCTLGVDVNTMVALVWGGEFQVAPPGSWTWPTTTVALLLGAGTQGSNNQGYAETFPGQYFAAVSSWATLAGWPVLIATANDGTLNAQTVPVQNAWDVCADGAYVYASIYGVARTITSLVPATAVNAWAPGAGIYRRAIEGGTWQRIVNHPTAPGTDVDVETIPQWRRIIATRSRLWVYEVEGSVFRVVRYDKSGGGRTVVLEEDTGAPISPAATPIGLQPAWSHRYK